VSASALVVAAPASGSGKTVVTLALLRALAREAAVASFKVGPDYIDPAFHARATGRPCHNLDSWAMRLETLAGLYQRTAADAELVIGEGVMGLFDGAPDGSGSTADLASLLGIGVVLVVDAGGMGASAAALIEGFARFRPEVEVVGVIFNRIAGERHLELLRRACDDRFPIPVLGGLPRDPALALPSRHLGLVQAGETGGLDAFLDHAGGLAGTHLDLERLRRLARPATLSLYGPPPLPLPPIGQRIAVARDVAFAFTYDAVLEGWRSRGAEIVPFSPLADEPPEASADAVFLPGGYPELHAGRIASAGRLMAGLRHAALRGAAVYGECGGYMVLGETLVDAEGTAHAMAGLLPVVTSFAERRRHLGYRRARSLADGPLGAPAAFRGHEFHYASELRRDGPPLFEARDAAGRALGPAGCVVGRIAGSFLHLIDRDPPAAAARG
jgi:cobyrinic acid a,c-diamide synthase